MTYSEELAFCVDVVRRAATPALAAFEMSNLPVSKKSDGTIVTKGDLDVNALIVESITNRYPEDGLLSEEGPVDSTRREKPRCWVVDPIDGTTHFARGDRDWAIMMALLVDEKPVVGAVYRPVLDELQVGALGQGATQIADGVSRELLAADCDEGVLQIIHGPSAAEIVAASGKDKVNFMERGHGLMAMITILPSGAHAYVASRTSGSEWDLVPHVAILSSVGGVVTDLNGNRHRFNKVDSRVRGGVVAAVSPDAHGRAMSLVRAASLQAS
jgi:myo-inositol-1(or 4)-monophosphatase